jgi:hypothetical protein
VWISGQNISHRPSPPTTIDPVHWQAEAISAEGVASFYLIFTLKHPAEWALLCGVPIEISVAVKYSGIAVQEHSSVIVP